MNQQDRQILALLARGRSLPQISRDLGIGIWRLRHRVDSLRRESGAANITALVAQAVRQGCLEGETA
jgi:DNA-binding CsgD family transcriptional regulator